MEVNVGDLEIGMYVSALDRPWEGTPFLVQGFYITSNEEIEKLERHCKFVYVDIYRSKVSDVRRKSRIIARPGAAKASRAKPKAPEPRSEPAMFRHRGENVGAVLFPHRKLRKYADASAFEQEMISAAPAYQDLAAAVADMIAGYQNGGSLDVSRVRETVGPLVDSMVRNPDACVWLARRRNADAYGCNHAVGGSVWAVALGRQLGLPAIDLQRVATGALLLDVGKLKLPQGLLLKPEKLSRGESELIKAHVQFGMEMLDKTGVMNRTVGEMIETHHERHGGHGYPKGLRGEEIPVFGRIAAIADCFDAITSLRSYAKAMSPSNAVKKLYAWRDIDFQAELVDEFIKAIGIYPAGTLVELSDARVGVVVAGYRGRRLRPQILMLLDQDKRPLPSRELLDLGAASQGEDDRALEISTSLEPGAYGINPDELEL